MRFVALLFPVALACGSWTLPRQPAVWFTYRVVSEGSLEPLAWHEVRRAGNFFVPKIVVPKWLDYFDFYKLSHPSQQTIDHIHATYREQMRNELKSFFSNCSKEYQSKDDVYLDLKAYMNRVENLLEKVKNDPKIPKDVLQGIVDSIEYALYPPYSLPIHPYTPTMQRNPLSTFTRIIHQMNIREPSRPNVSRAIVRASSLPSSKMTFPLESLPLDVLVEIISYLGPYKPILFRLNTAITALMNTLQSNDPRMLWSINNLRPPHAFRSVFVKYVHDLDRLGRTIDGLTVKLRSRTRRTAVKPGAKPSKLSLHRQKNLERQLKKAKRDYNVQKNFVVALLKSPNMLKFLQRFEETKLKANFLESPGLKKIILDTLLCSEYFLICKMLSYASFTDPNEEAVFLVRRVLQWYAEIVHWYPPPEIADTNGWVDYDPFRDSSMTN